MTNAGQPKDIGARLDDIDIRPLIPIHENLETDSNLETLAKSGFLNFEF
jgi:hypothetical protein